MLKSCIAADAGDASVRFDYWYSEPDDRKPGEALPMIVFLHGAGERGPDLNAVRVHGVPKLIEREPYRSLRVLTFSPQCQSDRYWVTQLYDLKAEIDWAVKFYNADPDAISVTGLSMGGYGTWYMLQSWPEYFSAAAPVCGGGIPWVVTPEMLKLPIRAFHGDADQVVPVHEALDMYDALRRAGGHNCELVLLHGFDHNSWEYAYERTDLIAWLAASRRR